jgi:membrane-bound lytic murein transglycosylase D
MKQHKRRPTLSPLLLALVLASSACGPFGKGSRNQTVVVPAPPQPIAPVPAAVESEPPLEAVAAPEPDAPLSTSEIDAVIQEAKDRFRAGERFYLEGDTANARLMFDRAVDVLLEAPAGAPDRDRAATVCAELSAAILKYDVEGLGGSERDPGYEESPFDQTLSATFSVDPSLELNFSGKLKLPASELPVEVNSEVMRYIAYFSSPRGKKTLVSGLRRMGRYQPMIQRILDEEGVPQELIYLGMAESGFKTRAMSHERATGIWQFMGLCANEYGLNRSSYYDDRLDPEKATRAAARHLRDLYKALGDWYLAIAAYNSGPWRVTKAVRRTGYADFWELSRRKVLPRETRNYIPIVLASIIMANNPGEYGLEGLVPDPPLEYNTIEVNAATHLGLVADFLGRPLVEIRELNPSILKDVAPAGYTIHVPKGTANLVISALRAVPPSQRASWSVHRLSYGETLTEIAEYYAVTPEQISMANGGGFPAPEAGDLVVVPVSYTEKTSTGKARSRVRSGKAITHPDASKGIRSGG